jgi:predicted PurR-regulated permease PerM
MDIAILILVIVAVILLGILTFFIFQIWVQSKETKLQLTSVVDDIKKNFVELESNQKKQSESITEHIKLEFDKASSNVNELKAKVQSLENELMVSNEIVKEQIEKKTLNTENRLIEHFNRITRTQESKIDDQFSSLKLKTESSIQSLSDSVNLLRSNIESRIKEIDSNLTEKLVSDLTHLTKSYSKEVKEEQSKVLDRFEQTSKEIGKKQSDILKAITEPLKINLNHND